MKNIDIKNMNAKQRLRFAELKANYYGRLVLSDILNFDNNDECTRYIKEVFKTWYKVTKNMYQMRDIELINKNFILL